MQSSALVYLATALTVAVAVTAQSGPAVAGGIRLASNLNAPGPVRLDGSGARVLFGQTTQSPCSGDFEALSADGGSKTQIAANAVLFESGFCRGIGRIVFSGPSVVYGYGGYGDYNLDIAASPCGESCTHLLTGLTGGVFLGVYNKNAYYSANFSDIDTVPLTGGTSSTIASGYFVRTTMLDSIAKNGWIPGLYFVDYNSSSVFDIDLSTKQVTAIISSMPHEGLIMTDSQRVYWWDGSQIIASKKTLNCLYPCSTLYSGKVTSIALDESELDNQKGSIFFADNTTLWRLPKSGGAQIMYTGKGVQVLQTDGAAVYFLDHGALKVLPTNATTSIVPLSLASSAAAAYSTLDDGFYWADDADGSPGSGKLNYVVQQVSQLDSLQYSTTDLAGKLYACSCKAATFAMLARSVLISHGQDVAASGVKIDSFFNTGGSQDPCPDESAPGAAWTGNGTWKNPVYNDVQLSDVSAIGSVDVASLLKSGPVFLGRKDSDLHWVLATNVATVVHGSSKVSGIAAYEPLTGSKVLLQGGAGSYRIALILDPNTNVWCSFSECSLVNDINNAALKFGAIKGGFTPGELSFLQKFTPTNYQTAMVKT
jgi:hypothetical protein